MDYNKEMADALSAIPGVELINAMQAEHCGVHYFILRLTEEALTKLCQIPEKININLHYDEGLIYRLSKGVDNLNEFLDHLNGLK